MEEDNTSCTKIFSAGLNPGGSGRGGRTPKKRQQGTPFIFEDQGEKLSGRTIIDHKGMHRAAVLVGQAEERRELPSDPEKRMVSKP
ncbi:hypothetical protein PGTUg99_036132 [Puccinia graminis f. sp. tritici]|uniref:Uncharacterized protein n=1 Tax=Puccinia graminis f. sp. tritici TaxID=56615 RepID=A0A5B0RVC0_PUCGR|nr:hypothetical protein PGTUg99_036132 [Puccinia graminis f. sp. tritici]